MISKEPEITVCLLKLWRERDLIETPRVWFFAWDVIIRPTSRRKCNVWIAVSLDEERLFFFFFLSLFCSTSTLIKRNHVSTLWRRTRYRYQRARPLSSHCKVRQCRQQHVWDTWWSKVYILYSVARIMKKALPENAKIAKEAKECVQECVSEFISFITSEGEAPLWPKCHVDTLDWRFIVASDRCQQEKRKTINGEDILWAMQSLGFENYTEALKIYLGKYREVSWPHGDEASPHANMCDFSLLDYKDRKNDSNWQRERGRPRFARTAAAAATATGSTATNVWRSATTDGWILQRKHVK